MRDLGLRRNMVHALIAALVLAGCETTGQSVGLGALVGGATGAIIGNQSGHAAEGALIGAAVGAAAGWVADKIVKDRQSRLAKGPVETATENNYKPEEGFRLEMKGGTISPRTVKPGDTVLTTYQYAVLGAGDGVPVQQTCLVKKGDRQLAVLDRKTVTRTDGTYESLIEFQVPPEAEPGEYIISQSVEANGKVGQRDVSFEVKTQTAQAPNQNERVLVSFVVE